MGMMTLEGVTAEVDPDSPDGQERIQHTQIPICLSVLLIEEGQAEEVAAEEAEAEETILPPLAIEGPGRSFHISLWEPPMVP
jgi:hypothetical protein